MSPWWYSRLKVLEPVGDSREGGVRCGCLCKENLMVITLTQLEDPLDEGLSTVKCNHYELTAAFNNSVIIAQI